MLFRVGLGAEAPSRKDAQSARGGSDFAEVWVKVSNL